jgi:predicted AAA+ superfamily ATPase
VKTSYIKRFSADFAFSETYGRQMRFITGPRQCGKTTMAGHFMKEIGSSQFYNWDEKPVKDLYRNNPDFLSEAAGKSLPGRKNWVCFDEIHKMPKWKNILKGLFDRFEDKLKFIVTGSSRLDIFRKSGDSLAGRYFAFALNPVICAEFRGQKTDTVMPEKTGRLTIEKMFSKQVSSSEAVETIMKFSGFPEPLTVGTSVFTKKWGDYYFERIIKEDMRDLTMIRQLEKLSDLMHMMPSKIGSPLSINSIREDLEINHHTASNYISSLVSNYAIFLVPPYSKNMNRLIKKEKKAYFYNFTTVTDKGSRFENFTAVELKSRVDLWNDAGADKYGLFFIRTRDGKETDFLLTKNETPFMLFEAKYSQSAVEPHHKRLAVQLDVPFVQVNYEGSGVRAVEKNIFTAAAGSVF